MIVVVVSSAVAERPATPCGPTGPCGPGGPAGPGTGTLIVAVAPGTDTVATGSVVLKAIAALKTSPVMISRTEMV